MIISVRGGSLFLHNAFLSLIIPLMVNVSVEGREAGGGVNGEQRWCSVYNANQSHSLHPLNYPPC